MTTFFELVRAVEENNRFNDGGWSDWDDAQHIERVYGQLEDKRREVALCFLDALIRADGDSAIRKHLCEAWDILEYGYAFNR